MNKILKIAVCALLPVAFSSCGEDYLNTAPQSSTTKENLFQSYETAQYAINGLGRLMSKQYLGTQGYNGEGTVYAYISDWPGDGLQKLNYSGWQNVIKSNYNQSNNNTNVHVSWYYYYRVIGNANQILENIPESFETNSLKNEWDYIKAQALTYRAYSYTMLAQIYSRRWTDRNGQSRGLVLRVDTSKDPLPCSSLAETFDLIYSDLDEALSLFASSGKDRPSDVDMRWMANEDVAHAVYSRAALVKNDWQNAITHSQLARKNYSIMGTEEYLAGFNTANKEWIWEVFEDDTQPIYYYSFYNYMSASCAGSASRTYPPLISKQIVDPIDPSDTRLAIYAIPTREELISDGVMDADGNILTDEKGNLLINGSGLVTEGDFFNRVRRDFTNKGRTYSTTNVGYYLGTKFIVKSGVGDGCVPIFRAAEMIYNEAEAQFRLGNEAAVRSLLEEATKPYQENYSCTKSGDELWNELVALRKFDLWCEGHSWFDLKRWGASMVRKTWSEGGSWATYFAGTGVSGGNYGPEDKNNWTLVIPQMETNYNNKVISQEDPNWAPGTDE